MAGVIVGTALALLVLLALVLNTLSSSHWRAEAEARQIHTLEVLLVIGELEAATNAALRGERGYLLTGEDRHLRTYNDAHVRTVRFERSLGAMTADNADQQVRLSKLRHDLESYYAVLDRAVAMRMQRGQEEAIAFVRTGAGRHSAQTVLATLDAIEREERRLLEAQSRVSHDAAVQNERLSYALAGLGLIMLVAASASAAAALRALGERAVAIAELRRIATTDELTGLPNRRRFFEQLAVERARADRQNTQFCLAVLDVDRFKSINDTYGHPVGDEILRSIAEALTDVTRGEDLVARIGGEEFAVLMPNTDIHQAERACERLRSRVAAQTVTLPDGRSIGATISVGIALHGSEGKESVLQRADAALYVAKREGRDTLRLAA
jgi:diguanylate cyclase (GGDEF)-like protein